MTRQIGMHRIVLQWSHWSTPATGRKGVIPDLSAKQLLNATDVPEAVVDGNGQVTPSCRVSIYPVEAGPNI